ncbi:MAG TPA: FHA domain-containing protein [Anaerolineales bacterium]|nr:FHA domain-containing protein [Anaerolineales bacterium]
MIASVVLALRLILAIALYCFLAWALITLWRELRQQADRLSIQKKPDITIEVRAGQKKVSQSHFSQTEILIGRDTNCDLSVMDEALSAQHARITFHHGQWWLEDLNSRNGTFLNREKLIVPAVVITGDEFKCGNTIFKIRIESDDRFPSRMKPRTGGLQ